MATMFLVANWLRLARVSQALVQQEMESAPGSAGGSGLAFRGGVREDGETGTASRQGGSQRTEKSSFRFRFIGREGQGEKSLSMFREWQTCICPAVPHGTGRDVPPARVIATMTGADGLRAYQMREATFPVDLLTRNGAGPCRCGTGRRRNACSRRRCHSSAGRRPRRGHCRRRGSRRHCHQCGASAGRRRHGGCAICCGRSS